jgi:hypothetical protein
MQLCRRNILWLLMGCGASWAQQAPPPDQPIPDGWVCPMHPDVRSDRPGVCPRCGMALVLVVPERSEYRLDLQSASTLKPGKPGLLILRVIDPNTGRAVDRLEVVHEKLMHVFLVSENLEFFVHLHPDPQPDGSFRLPVRLPLGGMYRLLADYYPSGSVPQLTLKTLFATGRSSPPTLRPSLATCRGENLTATFRFDPERPIAGLETKLFVTLDPSTEIQRYLGAWAHMLLASADLIDLLHLHPFLADGGPVMQFNIIFPRAGMHRLWIQLQRAGVINTVQFTIRVKSL